MERKYQDMEVKLTVVQVNNTDPWNEFEKWWETVGSKKMIPNTPESITKRYREIAISAWMESYKITANNIDFVAHGPYSPPIG